MAPEFKCFYLNCTSILAFFSLFLFFSLDSYSFYHYFFAHWVVESSQSRASSRTRTYKANKRKEKKAKEQKKSKSRRKEGLFWLGSAHFVCSCPYSMIYFTGYICFSGWYNQIFFTSSSSTSLSSAAVLLVITCTMNACYYYSSW